MPKAPQNATDIVEAAMSDRSVYDEMAKKEAEFWGRHLVRNTESDMSEQFRKESAANIALRANRNNFSPLAWATKNKMRFGKVLVLGCGTGRVEQQWNQRGLFGSVHGLDISPKAIESAREYAGRHALPFTYEVADLNFMQLKPDQYDLVLAVTALHHCLYLEHVADQVAKTLKPDGLLWLHDYIGESQFQYDPLRVEVVNTLLEVIPQKYRCNRLNAGRMVKPIAPRNLPLPSPFESIRSEEIPAIFKERFDVLAESETTSLIHLVSPNGTRSV